MTSLLFLALLVVVTAHITVADDDVEFANAIVEWVVSKGGFFSDKIEIRRLDTKDTSSPLGVFAKEDIAAHERLVKVPHSCYIGLWEDAAKMDEEDPKMTDYHYNICQLSQKLAAELELGNESEYAPFVNYIKAQKRGQIPATWSEAGKELLRKVQTPGADIVDWQDMRYKGECDFDPHVLALTLQRGYDTTLIPLWDMFNHKNGHVNTENDPMYANDGLYVRSTTVIEKGQELFATYDECVDCAYTSWSWGTPEILRDFGFVESYQRRWVFEEANVWFQIDEKDGKLEVEWDIGEPDEAYGMPDAAGVAFLRTELERLHRVAEEDLKEQPQDVPQHEWSTTMGFHEASITDIAMGLESAEAFLKQDKEL